MAKKTSELPVVREVDAPQTMTLSFHEDVEEGIELFAASLGETQYPTVAQPPNASQSAMLAFALVIESTTTGVWCVALGRRTTHIPHATVLVGSVHVTTAMLAPTNPIQTTVEGNVRARPPSWHWSNHAAPSANIEHDDEELNEVWLALVTREKDVVL